MNQHLHEINSIGLEKPTIAVKEEEKEEDECSVGQPQAPITEPLVEQGELEKEEGAEEKQEKEEETEEEEQEAEEFHEEIEEDEEMGPLFLEEDDEEEEEKEGAMQEETTENEEQEQCPVCEKNVTESAGLKEHLKRHYSTKVIRFYPSAPITITNCHPFSTEPQMPHLRSTIYHLLKGLPPRHVPAHGKRGCRR